MKLLIACDGTPGADAALEDLTRAGLPADAGAMVLTVADASIALASRAFAMAATGMTMADHRMARAARFVLGSVSSAVADRAGCSVEVVRAGSG